MIPFTLSIAAFSLYKGLYGLAVVAVIGVVILWVDRRGV